MLETLGLLTDLDFHCRIMQLYIIMQFPCHPRELWELQALMVLKERGELLAPQDSQVPKASWAPQDRRYCRRSTSSWTLHYITVIVIFQLRQQTCSSCEKWFRCGSVHAVVFEVIFSLCSSGCKWRKWSSGETRQPRVEGQWRSLSC